MSNLDQFKIIMGIHNRQLSIAQWDQMTHIFNSHYLKNVAKKVVYIHYK